MDTETFDPGAAMVVEAALEAALADMGLGRLDRADAAVQIVRKRIMRFASEGERDPSNLRERVLKSFR
ncbi:MAG: hypothetical protein ABSG76_26165 [Xanthobacteraceae bacterium]|jgi:hypothetical protein